MSDVVQYRKPYPQMTDWAPQGSPCCRATRQAWLCTRLADHDDRHEAGGPSGQLFASWPADEPDGGAPC